MKQSLRDSLKINLQMDGPMNLIDRTAHYGSARGYIMRIINLD